MRVALITSEFPGLPCSGGIGSYYYNLASILIQKNVAVEVFTSNVAGSAKNISGVRFHHVGTADRNFFAVHVADALSNRHQQEPFDVIECGELKAEAHLAARVAESAAIVVRIHSPSVILQRYLDFPLTPRERLAKVLRQCRRNVGLARRRLPLKPVLLGDFEMPWNANLDIEERNMTARADCVLVMN